MGNILFSSRVTMTMRPKSLMRFFTKCSNFKIPIIEWVFQQPFVRSVRLSCNLI
ncbi:hypothetical protein CsSME_00031247 [Camellia sinensis var. sinensis]